MADQEPVETGAAPEAPTDARRREAIVKLGRYTAYATPVVLASMSAQAQPAPISGAPPPSPPAPPPAPPPGPAPT